MEKLLYYIQYLAYLRVRNNMVLALFNFKFLFLIKITKYGIQMRIIENQVCNYQFYIQRIIIKRDHVIRWLKYQNLLIVGPSIR